MSTYRNRLMMVALVAGACLWGAGARALDLNDVCFHASFDEGLKADIAKGKAEPVEVIGKPEIVEGRDGGKALKLRNGVDAVGFELSGNLNPQAGALSLWLAPGANWGYDEKGNIKDGASQVLFHTGGISTEPQRMVLQTYWRGNLLGMITHDGENLVGGWSDGIFGNLFGYPQKTEAKEGAGGTWWNHLLFTWRDGRMDAYCNGVRLQSFQNPGVTFRKMGDRFYIGWKKDPNPKVNMSDSMLMKKRLVFFDPGCLVSHGIDKGMDTPWETLLSDVTLFGKFVNESQVEKIYEAGALEYARSAGSEKTASSVKFYASFDRDMTPDVTKGLKGGVPTEFGQPTLTDGKVGKALRLVSRKSGVAYPLAGHLRADRGTLAFWATTENWDSGDGSLVGLFSTSGKKRLQLQTNPKARSALEFQWYEGEAIADAVTNFGRCAAPVICDPNLIAGIERLMPKTWFYFTYTWGGGEVKAYRNGVLMSKEAFGKWTARDTAQLGDSFALGFPPDWPARYLTEPADATGKQDAAPWKAFLDKDYVTIIDELAILDRKLNEAEVGSLYRQGVKALMADEAAGIQAAELRVKPLPTQGRLVFEAIHGETSDDARSIVRFTSGDRTNPREVKLTITGDMSRGELPTADMKPGVYRAEYQLLDKTGALLARSTEQTFELAEREEWWNNKIGLDDIVLPPWTPMKKEKDSISCWGREIRFDGKPLPAQIVSRGDNLLAAPIALEMSVGGKPADFGAGNVNYSKVSETAMNREWSGSADGVTLTVRTHTEFDGFIWTTLQVTNAGGKPVTGLKLAIPYVQHNAMFIHTPGRGWRNQECPPKDVKTDKEWKAPYSDFSVPVWLGGYERGMQWLTEGRGGWYNKDKSDEIGVKPEGDRVTLTVKMIDMPCERKTFTIEFGLHPTPIKPSWSRKNRPGVGFYGVVPTLPRISKTHAGGIKALAGDGSVDPYVWKADYEISNLVKDRKLTLPEVSEEEWRSMDQKSIQTTRRNFDPDFHRYSFINSVASYYRNGEEIRERKWYKSEWETVPVYERMDPIWWSWFASCADTSYADWWVWFMKERWVHPDYAHFAGVYFDHGSPRFCGNTLHEGRCGYLDENDVIQPSYKIVAMRNMLKRIYCAVKGIDGIYPQGRTYRNPVTINTGSIIIAPLLSFANPLDGETFFAAPNGHVMDRLLPDLMAAEFSPSAWGYDENSMYGVIGAFSALLKGTPFEKWPIHSGGFSPDPRFLEALQKDKTRKQEYDSFIVLQTKVEREYNACMLLFDHSQIPCTGKYLGGESMRRAKGAFGFDEDDVEFKVVGTTGELVKGQGEKLHASVYLRKEAGKALIVAVNRDETPVKTELTIDIAGLGLKGPVKLTNAETGEAITATAGSGGAVKITPTIPDRDYLLVLVEKAE
jgi:hypothetical protein